MKGSRFLIFSLSLLLLVLAPVASPAQNHKNRKKELENRKKRINDEINEINRLLSQTKSNRQSSMGALVTLNLKLKKRQELINTINLEMSHLNNDIRGNEKRVDQLKADLEKLKQEYTRMILLAQRNKDTYSVLMFLFSSESFNQAFARLRYMQQYSEFRRKQAEDIVKTQTALSERLNELKSQRNEKNQLLGHEQEEKKVLAEEKTEKEKLLTNLQKKERQLKTELEKKKADAVKLQLAIKKLIEEEIRRKAEEAARAERARIAKQKEREAAEAAKAAKANKKPTKKLPDAKTEDKADKKERMVPELSDEAIALSADFSNNRGKLPWPVSKGIICETYGEHEHPAIKGFMMFNNGIDICAGKGTQARAVFDGEVTGIAVSPTGGKLVIIRHGEYLSVYTNLDEVLVKTGQQVKVKEPIGVLVFDEDEGKSLMNLQIWKGQKTMDPGGWLAGGR